MLIDKLLLLAFLFSNLATTLPAQAVHARIDFRALQVLDRSDETDRDEPYVVSIVKAGGTATKTSWGPFSVAERKYAFRHGWDGDKRYAHCLWQGTLQPDESVVVIALVMEKDGGLSDAQKSALAAAVGQAVRTEGGGSAWQTLAKALTAGLLDFLGRGNDDYLGSQTIRLWNVGGVLHKEIVTAGHKWSALVNPRKGPKVLSKSRRTVRVQYYHNAALRNVVEHQGSFNVWQLRALPPLIATEIQLVGLSVDGKGALTWTLGNADRAR